MPSNPQIPGRSNSTLWVLLGVLGVFALGYFYVAPQVAALETTRLETAALTVDRQAFETRINEVQVLSQQLKSRQADLDKLALAVPADPALDELIVSLESLASGAGIVLSTVQPVDAAANQEGVGVTVSARGSYSGVRLFLELLQSNLRPLKVTELTLSSSSDVTGASLVNASLSLVAATAGTPTPAVGSTPVTPEPSAGGPDA